MRIFLYVLAAAYPVLVFVSLAVFKIPLRFLSLLLVSAALIYFLGTDPKKKSLPTASWGLSSWVE